MATKGPGVPPFRKGVDPAGDGETMIGNPPRQGSSAQPSVDTFRMDQTVQPSSREVLAEHILLTMIARDDFEIVRSIEVVSYAVSLADGLIARLREPVE